MQITWIGHSCFKIEKDGFSIITDPYAPGSVPGLKPVSDSANLVICSHEHGDHNSRASVKIIPAETSAAGSEAAVTSSVKLTSIATWHDPEKGALRGPNTITVMDFGDEKIAHLGDLGCELTAEQKKQLTGMDVILVPVGGCYTIDGTQAAELIRELAPKLVIPMHYRDDQACFGYSVIDTVNTFLDSLSQTATRTGSVIDTAAIRTPVVVMTPAAL